MTRKESNPTLEFTSSSPSLPNQLNLGSSTSLNTLNKPEKPEGEENKKEGDKNTPLFTQKKNLSAFEDRGPTNFLSKKKER